MWKGIITFAAHCSGSEPMVKIPNKDLGTPDTDKELWKRPYVIAGPCSAETEEQLMETAVQLKALGKVAMLRVGIWKPRTRPGNFEGVGEEGLKWLQQVRQETQLPFCLEVATEQQLELALKYESDAIWIGARTSANPFSVQTLADHLKGVNIPVLIKNPINPDIDLWIGALERIASAGIQQIALIHRGFSQYGKSVYRNPPMWQLAVEMKCRFPNLAMFIDPSHICGNRTGLLDVVQTAMDLEYDGIFIESHRNPEAAWSDAAQQVTPAGMSEILNEIVWRKDEQSVKDLHDDLENLRKKIDSFDDEIIALLKLRMAVSTEIGYFKKDHQITILQPERWNSIRDRVLNLGKEAGLSEAFVLQYFNAVHMESIQKQDAVMNKTKI